MAAETTAPRSRARWLIAAVALATGVLLIWGGHAAPARAQTPDCNTPGLSAPEGDLTPAHFNTAYSFQLHASGGTAPYTFTVVGGALPQGLSMTSAGLIQGMPLALGQYSFTVQVADSGSPAGCDTGVLNLAVDSGTGLDGGGGLLPQVLRKLQPDCLQTILNTLLYHAPPAPDCGGP